MGVFSRVRVGVIFGGRSGEHEVSLVSATSVIQALDPDKYDVVAIGITPEGKWISSPDSLKRLKAKAGIEEEPERFLPPEPQRRGLLTVARPGDTIQPLDVVIPLVHGTYGEDGTLQGLLELADVPYVGAGVLGSAIGMDKIIQKQVFHQAGLRSSRFVWFPSSRVNEARTQVIRRVERALRYPVFVKPANTGSSVGINKAHNRKELGAALTVAVEYDRRVIVEQGINNAREIEVSVLGNEKALASVPGEVVPSNEFYDYDAKYVDGKSTAVIPAKLPVRVMRRIQRMAIDAYTAIDCAGMARADFFVTRSSNTIYINELNTIPGFTSVSMYTKLWEASGISYRELLDRLIALALQRHRDKSSLRRTYRPSREWYKS
jgi:D-alanine-D-alanine ligase